jgi:hypothetical protein
MIHQFSQHQNLATNNFQLYIRNWVTTPEKPNIAFFFAGEVRSPCFAGQPPPLVKSWGPVTGKDDWAAWTTFTTKVGGPTQVVGDDLTVPGPEPWVNMVQTLLNV